MKKNIVLNVLAALCLSLVLVSALPMNSIQQYEEYDPWYDVDDNGIINMLDLYNVALRFGTTGTPINKTQLLLELQSKIDSLNMTIIDLQSELETLENQSTRLRYVELRPIYAHYDRPEDLNWLDWNLSAIIPDGAVSVEVRIQQWYGSNVGIRKKGNTLDRTFGYMGTIETFEYYTVTCELDDNRVLETGYWKEVPDTHPPDFWATGYWIPQP